MSDPAFDANAIPGLTPELQAHIRAIAANLGVDPIDVRRPRSSPGTAGYRR